MPCRTLAAALAAIVFTAATAAAQTPTLGDLAKKEQERRKSLKAPAKVLDTADLPKGTPPPAGSPGAPQKAPDAGDKPEQKPEEPVKDEAWWRARISQAREELRRNGMFAEALQTRINSLSSDFAARDDPYQRATIGEERVKTIAELDRVKADIELQKKKIGDIEEEARRAGVPPGWLR